MQFFDKDQFREDLKGLLSSQDIELFIQLFEARRCPNPTQAVAAVVGLTEAGVKSRTLKTLDKMRRIAGYAVLLERAGDGSDAEPETPKSN